MPSIIYNNLPFPEDALTDPEGNFTLGRFMTAWSQTESLCGFLFREILDLDWSAAQIVFDRIGTREQIEIVAELLENSETLAPHAPVMEEVRAISIARNKIVHAGWGELDGEKSRFYHGLTSKQFEDIAFDKPKGASLRKRFIFTLTDINSLTEQCSELNDGPIQSALNVALSERQRKQHAESERRRSAPQARFPRFE